MKHANVFFNELFFPILRIAVKTSALVWARVVSCTILGLVEKLCMQCAWPVRPSHTFRLLTKRQSETIPRCRIAAVNGPTTSGSTARRAPGAKGRNWTRGSPKAKERSSRDCFPQEIHTCGNGLSMDFLPK